MAKIIVAAPPVTGEVSPLLQLARGLKSGHRMRRTDAGLAGIGKRRATK